jgi:hypothetical protein
VPLQQCSRALTRVGLLLLWRSRALTRVGLPQGSRAPLHTGHPSTVLRRLVLAVLLPSSSSASYRPTVPLLLLPPSGTRTRLSLPSTPCPSLRRHLRSGTWTRAPIVTCPLPPVISSPPNPSHSTPLSIVVCNRSLLPVTSTGYTLFSTPSRPLHLRHILVSPHIIKNLIYVHQFTIDNQVSVEFDLYSLSVKDLHTRDVIVRCNSSGQLYPLLPSSHPPPHALLVSATPSTLWHRRLGHLGFEVLSRLVPSCNKLELETLCHACQLGWHTRLPFSLSHSRASKNFDLIHCDLWTSPVLSVFGYKYYLVILDDCSHYLWTFQSRLKSDTFQTLSQFFAYVKTQFGYTVKSVQCDNGREFDNSTARTFFLGHGVPMRLSCPHTSPQNG